MDISEGQDRIILTYTATNRVNNRYFSISLNSVIKIFSQPGRHFFVRLGSDHLTAIGPDFDCSAQRVGVR